MRITTSVKIQSSLFLLRLSATLAGHNYTIKMFARETWKPWALTSTDGKPWLQNDQLGGRKCSKAFPSLKRHLPNKRRQRDKREIDQKFRPLRGRDCHGISNLTRFVREPPIRAQYFSLIREWRMPTIIIIIIITTTTIIIIITTI